MLSFPTRAKARKSNRHQSYDLHAGRSIKVQGIMVHSTGANNPYLKRYVGPDDGRLGKNKYNNHWNQPMDRQVCVHGFVGKLQDGTIATYQTLPGITGAGMPEGGQQYPTPALRSVRTV